MRDEKSNYLGFILFFLFIMGIVIAGSGIIYYMKQEKMQEKTIVDDKLVISDKLKNDKDKDFVYYSDKELISNELNIYYSYPIINLASESADLINAQIKEKVENVKAVEKYESEESCTNNSENIKSANSVEYADYNYNEYISVTLTKNTYTCEKNSFTISEIVSYTFNCLTGELITYDNLLKKYDLTYTKVLERIKNKLESDQTYNEETALIRIEDTMNELSENKTYIIYIDQNGELVVKYIVKTNEVDYNDVITLN